ncbi:MAG: hypothetical protein PHI73_01720 [Patescibacteria group bacterium]|nr:hypothetical protein [Patescibacteria group bacterium]
MDWRVFLKKDDVEYRAFKIVQGASLDITFIPKTSLWISKEHLIGYNIGDQLLLQVESDQGFVNHYSAHSRTGQRHIKISDQPYAIEPFHGQPFRKIDQVIPLLTYIAVTTPSTKEAPSKGKWYGYTIPENVNYCIFDLIAFPKGSNLNINFQLGTVVNTKKSIETFGQKILEFRNCNICVLLRTSTHDKSTLKQNVLIQQNEGITTSIVRVMDNQVLLTVAETQIGNVS